MTGSRGSRMAVRKLGGLAVHEAQFALDKREQDRPAP
jgi:hypothetical protein